MQFNLNLIFSKEIVKITKNLFSFKFKCEMKHVSMHIKNCTCFNLDLCTSSVHNLILRFDDGTRFTSIRT